MPAGRPTTWWCRPWGGIMSLTGQPGGPPARVGSSVGDIVAGPSSLPSAVNGALYRRTMTGEGMKLDVSMLDCQVAILENALARYFASGEVPGPLGTRHPSITPFQAYATGDGHVVISAGNNALFATLCAALGQARSRGRRALRRQRGAQCQHRRAGAGVRGDSSRTHPTAALAHGAGGGGRAVLADQPRGRRAGRPAGGGAQHDNPGSWTRWQGR